MKKNLRISLSFLILTALLVLLTACFGMGPSDDRDPLDGHVHAYGDYTFDEDRHYRTCSSCGEKTGEAHTFGAWSNFTPETKGKDGVWQFRECTVCHYRQEQPVVNEETAYYGYRFLQSMGSVGEPALYAYRKILAGSTVLLYPIPMNDGGYAVSEDDLFLAFNCFRADYPQHFWLDDGYGYVYGDDGVTELRPHYNVDDTETLSAMKTAFENAADALLLGIDKSASDVEREFAVHDKIVTSVQYASDSTGAHIHDAYGALVNGSAVCDGYVKAFQYLLYRVGISNTLIYGDVTVGTQQASHTWNAVLLDGEYYLVDVTWDDPTGGAPSDVSYNYLNLTSELFAQDHTPDPSVEDGVRVRYDLPAADGTKYHYYTYYGYAKDALTVDNLAAVIAKAVENGVSEKYPLYLTTASTQTAIEGFFSVKENVNALYEKVMTLLGMDKPNVNYSVDSNCRLVVLTVTQDALTLEDHHFGESSVTRAATCTVTGISERTCKYCGYVDETVIPLKDHTYGEWVITTPATASTAGEKERVCTACTHKETKTIPILVALSPLARDDYYGFLYLSSLPDAENLLHFYNLIVDTVESDLLPESIALDANPSYSLSVDDLQLVYRCYRADYPQHFWLEDGYSYTSDRGIAYSVSPKYNVTDKTALASMKTAVAEKIALLLDGIDGNMTDVEREIEIHDRLVLHNTYDTTLSLPHVHDLYGSLVNKTSVCDGYAEAFQYLMYECGIPCTILAGEASNGTGTENHAWNAVSLGGEWYLVDVTWDDPVGGSADNLDYTYLNITTEQMSKNHTVDPAQTVFTVPTCTATDAQYYFYKGYTAESFTVAAFRSLLEKEIADGLTENYVMYITSGNMTMAKVSAAFEDPTFNQGFFNACKELLHLSDVSLFYSVDASGHVLTFTVTEKTDA